MLLMILGLGIWSGMHALPLLQHRARDAMIERLGPGRYRGAFALVIAFSILLMVVGWRMTGYHDIYFPPDWGKGAAGLGMVIAFLLFGAAKAKTNLKRHIRHPQLLSVAVWGGSHLLANGDLRSIILFGGLGLWALTAIPLANARDGAWVRPDPFPRKGDIRWLIISLVAFTVMIIIHPWIFGVTPY